MIKYYRIFTVFTGKILETSLVEGLSGFDGDFRLVGRPGVSPGTQTSYGLG